MGMLKDMAPGLVAFAIIVLINVISWGAAITGTVLLIKWLW